MLANFRHRHNLLICGVPAGRELEQLGQQRPAEEGPISQECGQGSVIVVLTIDATVDAGQLGRLAQCVPLCLARTGTHSGHVSGDLATPFSVAKRIPHDTTPLLHTVTAMNKQHPAIDTLSTAVAETTEESVINALCTAHSIDGRDGHRLEAFTA